MPLTFNDWSRGCYIDMPERVCSRGEGDTHCDEDNCPRYDEFTADVEADAYDSYMDAKLHEGLDKESSLGS